MNNNLAQASLISLVYVLEMLIFYGLGRLAGRSSKPELDLPHVHRWSDPEWCGLFIGRRHCLGSDCDAQQES